MWGEVYGSVLGCGGGKGRCVGKGRVGGFVRKWVGVWGR